MIRIISDEPAPEAIKRTFCGDCGCQFEYTLSDTTERSHTDYTGTSETYRFIRCPKCSREINLGYV